MNKNITYVVLLALLCTLAGVVVGAGIVQKTNLPRRCHGKQGFSERAEAFMKHGPRGYGEKHLMRDGFKKDGGGLLDMLSDELDLNKDQQAKVKEVLEKARQEIDVIGKNVRSAITEVKDRGDKEIMKILSPEQQKKFNALLEEFKKKCAFDMRS